MTVVAVVYFVYLAALAGVRLGRAPRGASDRERQALFAALTVLAAVAVFGMAHLMPLLYLLAGYWLPALFAGAPDLRLERRLLAADHRLFGPDGLARFARRAPRALVDYLELSYLLCYAVVPAGYVWLLAWGADRGAIDLFWSTVLGAAFACYGVLPWRATRAPRALEVQRAPTRSPIRRLNLAVLDRASVQWNTFPSGHTAASVATAVAVGSVAPGAGVFFGVVALSIAAGSVAGRYHYAADALAGAAVAVAAFVTASAAHAP